MDNDLSLNFQKEKFNYTKKSMFRNTLHLNGDITSPSQGVLPLPLVMPLDPFFRDPCTIASPLIRSLPV